MSQTKPPKPVTSHDRIFKEFLHRFLPDFMRLFFPEEAARLNFATLTFLDKELIINLPRQKLRITDLMAQVETWAGKPETIIVHVEVEGRQKQAVPQRMFEYYGLTRLLYHQPVLPLALILQPQAGGLRWHSYKEVLFQQELVRFRYGQVGLRDLPADVYIQLDNPVAAALSVMMKPGVKLRGRARWAKLGELKVKALLKVHESVLTDGDKLFLMGLVETYLPNEALPMSIRGGVMEALADVELMWHERIEQKGVEKGIQQGIQQGKQQGKQQRTQELILRLLHKKFGRVPEVVVQKVQVIDDVDILEHLFDQALMADSLAEIALLT
jgi:hypothetical protein